MVGFYAAALVDVERFECSIIGGGDPGGRGLGLLVLLANSAPLKSSSPARRA